MGARLSGNVLFKTRSDQLRDREPSRTLVVLEQRFERDADGRVWGPGTFGTTFWSRYRDVFDHVTVLARIREVNRPAAHLERSDGPSVDFIGVPSYVGPGEYLMRRSAVKRAVVGAMDVGSSVILRVPSPIGSMLVPYLLRLGKPYAVEVIGDAYDVMSPDACSHPLRPFFRWWLTARQRRDCNGASAAAYVTENALQQRYPCLGYSVGVSDVRVVPFGGRQTFTTHYSSVALTECVAAPRSHAARPMTATVLVTVATLAQMYKGVDVLLDALRRCVDRRLDLYAVVVGEGKCLQVLQDRARFLGLNDRVRFTGYLRREEVIDELDAANIFVLPSRQEGLPRALIEAMARGLPCIATSVGGIPELLPQGDLVAPGDAGALAKKIAEIVSDSRRLDAMSRRNWFKAHDYLEDVLSVRRTAFYEQVRSTTRKWVRHQRHT